MSGTIEIPCNASGLFFLGAFKLMEYPEKIGVDIDNSFAEFFTDPRENWDKIRRVFEPFGSSGMISAASFSKSPLSGDGGKTVWMINGMSPGVIVQCYEIASALGILADPEACRVTFTSNPTREERAIRKKWQALIGRYEAIKSLQVSQLITAYAVAGLLDSEGTLDRSPQQIKLYNSYLAKTAISSSEQCGADSAADALYKCPYDMARAVFGDLIDVLRGGWWTGLMTLAAPEVEYSIETVDYEVTADDVTNKYFEFPYDDYAAHIVSMLVFPDDSEEPEEIPVTEKLCYGWLYGASGNEDWVCDECEYADTCASAKFINPSKADWQIQNRVSINGVVGVVEGVRVRIVYKRVEVS